MISDRFWSSLPRRKPYKLKFQTFKPIAFALIVRQRYYSLFDQELRTRVVSYVFYGAHTPGEVTFLLVLSIPTTRRVWRTIRRSEFANGCEHKSKPDVIDTTSMVRSTSTTGQVINKAVAHKYYTVSLVI